MLDDKELCLGEKDLSWSALKMESWRLHVVEDHRMDIEAKKFIFEFSIILCH